MVKRIYISGPMTGFPDNNYPAFNRAAMVLRERGFHVENPAENPPPPCGSWAGWMRIALAQLTRCDAVALLPDWEQSRGARLEYTTAFELDMEIKDLERFING